MTKLKFEYTSLQRVVIPSLNLTINNLSSTISSANSMDVPGDFAYASELRNLPSFLSKQKNKLIYANEWIEKSNNKYQSSQNELNAILEALDNVDIKTRIRRVN